MARLKPHVIPDAPNTHKSVRRLWLGRPIVPFMASKALEPIGVSFRADALFEILQKSFPPGLTQCLS